MRVVLFPLVKTKSVMLEILEKKTKDQGLHLANNISTADTSEQVGWPKGMLREIVIPQLKEYLHLSITDKPEKKRFTTSH